jgi:CxxC motif-containing protein (DUF1111 family)
VSGHFPLHEAMACANCHTVFSGRSHQVCPSCTSASIDFVEALLRDIARNAFERATRDELSRVLHVPTSA